MFGGLTDDDLAAIRPLLNEFSYPIGSVILHQGMPNNTVFFIVSGDVIIQKHPDDGQDTERDIATLHTGDSFGEMELIDIQPCAASVVCLSDVEVITLSNRDLYILSQSHLKTYTMIIMNLARDVSRRLRSTDNLLSLVTKK
jgi:CRP-like cAMP-binding protein